MCYLVYDLNKLPLCFSPGVSKAFQDIRVFVHRKKVEI